MMQVINPRSRRDTVRDGLRVLARIIAREMINPRSITADELPPDLSSPDGISSEFANVSKESSTNHSPFPDLE